MEARIDFHYETHGGSDRFSHRPSWHSMSDDQRDITLTFKQLINNHYAAYEITWSQSSMAFIDR